MRRLSSSRIMYFRTVLGLILVRSPIFRKLGYLSSLRRKKRRVVTEDELFDLYDIELSEEDFAAE